MKKLLYAVLLSALCAPAFAESLVVQTCGTLPQVYAPGATRLETIDVNGNRCGSTAGAPAATVNQGTAGASPWLTNVTQFGGTAVVTGTGASGLGIPRVTVSSDSAVSVSPYPPSATPITGSITGTTAAVSANLAAAVGKTTYICGFSVQANATAATSIPNASITGAIGGTLPFIEAVAALPAVGVVMQTFTPCIPASAQNTAIGVNAGAAGAGGNTTVYAWGFQQ